ncbi:MAG TPA: hypothetical protein VFZ98_10065 [Vicinamibacterales bacterium]
MIKRVVSLLVFLLIANAGIRLGLVVFHDQRFKDAVRELALFAGQPPAKTDDALRGKVMQLAQDNQIPLDPDFLKIHRNNSDNGEKVTIEFAYAVMVPLAPGYNRRFEFDYTTP